MNLRDEWPWYLGGAVAAGLLGLVITRRDPLGVGLKPAGPPPPRVPDPPGAPLRWIEIEAPYRLFTGDTYRACVSVPFGAGFLVTESRVVEGATKMGFRDVTVTTEIPPGWPGPDSCDRFIEGTWGLEDRIVDGDKHVKTAWRRTRA